MFGNTGLEVVPKENEEKGLRVLRFQTTFLLSLQAVSSFILHYLSCFTEERQNSTGKLKNYFYEETNKYILKTINIQVCFLNQCKHFLSSKDSNPGISASLMINRLHYKKSSF